MIPRSLLILPLCLLAAGFGAPQSFINPACINTSYSAHDEQVIGGSTYHLIIGAFAHRGRYFYQDQLALLQPRLAEGMAGIDDLNDAAMAYLKLGAFPEAEALLDRIDVLRPDWYPAVSNRGVLYKKMGRFAEAAVCIKQALHIKPEGHMGLGDYYLRMLHWSAAAQTSSPQNNFLGQPYVNADGQANITDKVSQSHAVTLIKNDNAFADVKFVLGDYYLANDKLQLAYRCYHRALQQGHPCQGLLHDRLDLVRQGWFERSEQTGFLRQSEAQLAGVLASELAAAADYRSAYEAYEKQALIRSGTASIAAIQSKMRKDGVNPPQPRVIGLFEGRYGIQPAAPWRFWVVVVGIPASVCLSLALCLLAHRSGKTSAARGSISSRRRSVRRSQVC